jgi:uncharacterized protein YggE
MSGEDTITVTGSGVVRVAPDTAVLRCAAEARSPHLGDAFAAATRAAEAMASAALAGGVRREDIASSALSVVSETAWQEGRGQQLLGYAATRGLTLAARDLADTGTLLDAVVAAGGDAARIIGVSLVVSEPAPARARAQEAAFRDARSAAERLASLAGRSLGAAVRIDAGAAAGGPGQPGPPRLAAFAAAEGSQGLEAGQTDIAATVTVTWALA